MLTDIKDCKIGDITAFAKHDVKLTDLFCVVPVDDYHLRTYKEIFIRREPNLYDVMPGNSETVDRLLNVPYVNPDPKKNDYLQLRERMLAALVDQ